jgi:hypothetical protein
MGFTSDAGLTLLPECSLLVLFSVPSKLEFCPNLQGFIPDIQASLAFD